MSRSAGMATISFDFSPTFVCASTIRWRAAKAETVWIGSLPPFAPERREVLPSMAMSSTGVFVSAPTQAVKQRRNAAGSREAKMSPRWSWLGVPLAKGRNRRIDLLLAEAGDVGEA